MVVFRPGGSTFPNSIFITASLTVCSNWLARETFITKSQGWGFEPLLGRFEFFIMVHCNAWYFLLSLETSNEQVSSIWGLNSLSEFGGGGKSGWTSVALNISWRQGKRRYLLSNIDVQSSILKYPPTLRPKRRFTFDFDSVIHGSGKRAYPRTQGNGTQNKWQYERSRVYR